MTRTIEYWLVRRFNILRETQFYRVSLSGDAMTTENPKLAMRWMTQEGAEQFAERLGWQWQVKHMEFRGYEKAG